MKRVRCVLLVVPIAVLRVGTVLAQDAQTPTVERFRLNGEQWTCTVGGKPLSGMLLKPEGNGPFSAFLNALGDANWAFYRAVFGAAASTMPTTKGEN